MPAAQLQPVDETGLIEAWRAEALVRSGYDPLAAAGIAARLDVDLHTAIDLVARGCPADLAVRILL